MYAMDAVRKCANDANKPITQIGLDMGTTRQYVTNISTRKSTPKADTLARMLDVCGYKLCAVPRGQVDEQTMYVID